MWTVLFEEQVSQHRIHECLFEGGVWLDQEMNDRKCILMGGLHFNHGMIHQRWNLDRMVWQQMSFLNTCTRMKPKKDADPMESIDFDCLALAQGPMEHGWSFMGDIHIYLIPGTWYEIPARWYLIHDTWYIWMPQTYHFMIFGRKAKKLVNSNPTPECLSWV